MMIVYASIAQILIVALTDAKEDVRKSITKNLNENS